VNLLRGGPHKIIKGLLIIVTVGLIALYVLQPLEDEFLRVPNTEHPWEKILSEPTEGLLVIADVPLAHDIQISFQPGPTVKIDQLELSEFWYDPEIELPDEIVQLHITFEYREEDGKPHRFEGLWKVQLNLENRLLQVFLNRYYPPKILVYGPLRRTIWGSRRSRRLLVHWIDGVMIRNLTGTTVSSVHVRERSLQFSAHGLHSGDVFFCGANVKGGLGPLEVLVIFEDGRTRSYTYEEHLYSGGLGIFGSVTSAKLEIRDEER